MPDGCAIMGMHGAPCMVPVSVLGRVKVGSSHLCVYVGLILTFGLGWSNRLRGRGSSGIDILSRGPLKDPKVWKIHIFGL